MFRNMRLVVALVIHASYFFFSVSISILPVLVERSFFFVGKWRERKTQSAPPPLRQASEEKKVLLGEGAFPKRILLDTVAIVKATGVNPGHMAIIDWDNVSQNANHLKKLSRTSIKSNCCSMLADNCAQ